MKKYLVILSIVMICALFALGVIVWWWLFSIGLAILGTLGYFDRIFHIKWSRKWSFFLLAIFLLFSVAYIIANIIKSADSETQIADLSKDLKQEKNHNRLAKEEIANLIEKERDLRQKLKQAEDAATEAKGQIADLAEYGEVATYNFNGYQRSGQFLSPFTPVSKWTEGYLTVRNGFYYFDCGQNSMKHYESIIEKCPKFPFPYLALSQCLLHNKNPSWKEYATKAQSILKKTTKIPLHSQDHDGWLTQVNKLLDPTQIESVLSPEVKQKSNK
jgi:preprotein translocase subunit Sss1